MLLEELSVVVPAFDESLRIAGTLRGVAGFLERSCGSFEIVVVDDGSDDCTAETARSTGIRGVRVVSRGERGGKGAAVRTGIRAARHRWVLVMDADHSVPISESTKLAPFASTHTVVIGSKWARGSEVSYPWGRRVSSAGGRLLVGLLAVRGFRDTQCGFKLFETATARRLFEHQRLDGFGYDFEILFLARRLGIEVAEVPIRVAHAKGGNVRFASYWRTLGELLALAGGRILGRYPSPAAAPRPSEVGGAPSEDHTSGGARDSRLDRPR